MRLIFRQAISFLCLGALLTACTGNLELPDSANPAAKKTAQAMLLVTPSKGESQLENRHVEYRNCSAKQVRRVSLASEEQVECSIAFSEKAASASNSTEIVLTAEQKAGLEKQIQDLFQDVCTKNATDVEQKVIEIPIDRVFFYNIYWKQLNYTSSISFSSDSITYSVPYTYTLEIPQYAIEMQKACTG